MILRIKAKPNSKTDEISREADGTVRIKIKAPPVDGKANKYLIDYVASRLDLPWSKVTLRKGDTSQFKTLEIDLDEVVVMERLGL